MMPLQPADRQGGQHEKPKYSAPEANTKWTALAAVIVAVISVTGNILQLELTSGPGAIGSRGPAASVSPSKTDHPDQATQPRATAHPSQSIVEAANNQPCSITRIANVRIMPALWDVKYPVYKVGIKNEFVVTYRYGAWSYGHAVGRSETGWIPTDHLNCQ